MTSVRRNWPRFKRWSSTAAGIVVLARVGATLLAIVIFAVCVFVLPNS